MQTPAVALGPTTAPSIIETPVVLGAPLALADINGKLESRHPSEIMQWAVDHFAPQLSLAASFADTLLIDVATKVLPDIEVLFLDTGFHYAETLDTVRTARARYDLNLTILRAPASDLSPWHNGADRCCDGRKVQPLHQALAQRGGAWLSGLRRTDSESRATTRIVERDRRGLIKINPLAAWNNRDVERYMAEHSVLVNPLAEKGYESIGCWPCTEPATGREGRWSGSEKTECGLHL